MSELLRRTWQATLWDIDASVSCNTRIPMLKEQAEFVCGSVRGALPCAVDGSFGTRDVGTGLGSATDRKYPVTESQISFAQAYRDRSDPSRQTNSWLLSTVFPNGMP